MTKTKTVQLPSVEVPEGMQLLGWLCQWGPNGSPNPCHSDWRHNQLMPRPGWAQGDWCPDCVPVFRRVEPSPPRAQADHCPPDAEAIAQEFHERYERLAPTYHYSTRKESAVPWSEVPNANKGLMIATVRSLLDDGVIKQNS